RRGSSILLSRLALPEARAHSRGPPAPSARRGGPASGRRASEHGGLQSVPLLPGARGARRARLGRVRVVGDRCDASQSSRSPWPRRSRSHVGLPRGVSPSSPSSACAGIYLGGAGRRQPFVLTLRRVWMLVHRLGPSLIPATTAPHGKGPVPAFQRGRAVR